MTLTLSAAPRDSSAGSSRSDPAIVVATGDVDERTAPRLREQLVELVGAGRHHVVVDLDGVEVLDATALGVLVGAARRVRPHGGSLRLVCSRQQIVRSLTATGLTTLLPVYASLAAAVADP